MEITRNIAYTAHDNSHPRHLLDIYLPKDVAGFPVLMFVSGGGWSSGSKDWVANLGPAFAAQGIAVVTVDHRLLPDVTYDQQVEDLARAFVWLKQNIATYGGDPDQIIVGGHSAGGHLIGLLAMDERYLDATGYKADSISGVLLVSAALDVGDRFGRADIEAASPLNHVRAGLPPFLLLSAESDLPGLSKQAETMTAALQAVDVSVETRVVANRDHFNIVHHLGSSGDAATQIIGDWLARSR